MCKKSFRFLRQYLGEKLLNYILNTADLIRSSVSYEQIEFNSNQKKVIEELHNLIVEIRIRNASKHIFCDLASHDLIMLKSEDADSIFNAYRKLCGGAVPEFASDDVLLNFLAKIAIREYPNLLFKAHRYLRSDRISIFSIAKEIDEIIDIVKTDTLDTISNKKDGCDYLLIINTNKGMSFNYQVSSMVNTLIERAFNNSCNKMDSTLEGLLKEIELEIEIIRELANKKEVEFSSFIGIKGLALKGLDKIEFPNASIRLITDKQNPSIMIRDVVTLYKEGEDNLISGCILETKHKTKMLEKPANPDSYSSIIDFNHWHNEAKEFLDFLSLAIIFTKKIDRAMNAVFFENGFPLITVGNYSIPFSAVTERVFLETCDIEEIKKWIELLQNENIKKIHLSLERLKMAIFERRSIEDSIIDGIIAWEGIFGGIGETAFKVTSSICRYVDYHAYAKSKESFFSDLKNLYDLRSKIVHGSKAKKVKIDDETRTKVINIAIDCIKNILQDEEMLKLEPEQRVKRLVYI